MRPETVAGAETRASMADRCKRGEVPTRLGAGRSGPSTRAPPRSSASSSRQLLKERVGSVPEAPDEIDHGGDEDRAEQVGQEGATQNGGADPTVETSLLVEESCSRRLPTATRLMTAATTTRASATTGCGSCCPRAWPSTRRSSSRSSPTWWRGTRPRTPSSPRARRSGCPPAHR
jgi:hypothetical protein